MNNVKFKKLYQKILIISLCLNFNIAYAKNHEFNDLIIFGDSLSDVGNINFFTSNGTTNSKLVAGNMPIYNEYLSQIFTGKEILPATQGGTNYAITNAVVRWAENSIYTQFNKYLENHKIIPNNLYILWGGGNDLPGSVFEPYTLILAINIELKNSIINTWNFIASNVNNTINKEFKPIENIDYENSILSNSDLFMYYMSQELINQGAKYIIVPNLFDTGTVPRFIFPEAILSIVSQYILDANPQKNNILRTRYLLPFGLNKLIYNSINQILALESQSYFNHLNKKNNIPLGQTGREFILNNLHNRYSKLGLGNLAVKLADLFSFATRSFNYFLDEELSTLDSKIVYVDIYHLFNEIIDNPKFYGFDDILLPTCSEVFFASETTCKNKTPGIYHPEKTYLFSDGVHPSPHMHLIFAQYIESIFNAPVKVSAISQQLINFNNNAQENLFNQLSDLKLESNQLLPFVSISGNIAKMGDYYNNKNTNANTLNIGVAYSLDNNLIIGSMINAGFGNYHPFNDFKYKYNNQLFSLFTKYNINDNFSIISNINLGRINASDINRIIILGNANYIEKSNTHGKSLGFNIAANYDFYLNNGITLTPYISFDIHNYKIDPIFEQSNKSTSMHFDKSSTTDKNIKCALKLNKQFNNQLNNNAYIELGINSPVDNHPIKIIAALKNVKTQFTRQTYFNNKPTLNINIGFNKILPNNNLSLKSNLNYKINNYHYKQFVYSIGFNFKF